MPAFNIHTVDADFFISLCGTREEPRFCGYGSNHNEQDQIKAWLQDHSLIVIVGTMLVFAVFFYAWVLFRAFRPALTDLEAGIPLEERAPHPKTAPANPAVVDALPVHAVTEAEVQTHGECVICCEEFEVGDEVIVLPCGHREFHAPCMKPWLIQKGECPCCREELPLYFG